MSKHSRNGFNTTNLTLSVMKIVAHRIGVDIHDDCVANALYEACRSIEQWNDHRGFGSADSFKYIRAGYKALNKIDPILTK